MRHLKTSVLPSGVKTTLQGASLQADAFPRA